MFEIVKNICYITALCKNGEIEGTYSFVERWNEYWGEIASLKFYNEFGVYPKEISMLSRGNA